MIYPIAILFMLAFVMYQKFQYQDLRNFRNTTWKTWANVMKGILFSGGHLLQLFPSPWEDYLMALAISALVFEFGYNKIVVKRDWFFNGSSSKFDALGNWKWISLFAFLFITIIIKIFL